MSELSVGNLFLPVPPGVSSEFTQRLAQGAGVRVERIVSHGHRSADDFWYDQSEHEWVAVLAGESRLRFADPPRTLTLKAGDHVLIPAGAKHRVESTSEDEPTVWLAVFFQ